MSLMLHPWVPTLWDRNTSSQRRYSLGHKKWSEHEMCSTCKIRHVRRVYVVCYHAKCYAGLVDSIDIIYNTFIDVVLQLSSR